jgi:hypothetical protein
MERLLPSGSTRRRHDAARLLEAHGFTAPVHVARFVDIVFAFGPRFDADSRYSWAATILSDRALASPEQRIEQLHLAALKQARFDGAREDE